MHSGPRSHLDIGAGFLVIWRPCSKSGSHGELSVPLQQHSHSQQGRQGTPFVS